MAIEICGVGFRNKGAELLLRTAVDEMHRRLPSAAIAVDTACGSYEQRASLGLRQPVPAYGRRDIRQRIYDRLLQARFGRCFEDYGMVGIGAMDGLLDLSGFAYGDTWGPWSCDRLLERSRSAKRYGKPVILMPQALGPFRDPKLRSVFLRSCEFVDCVYARDDMSYSYLVDVGLDSGKIDLAPDITLFRSGRAECCTPTVKQPGVAIVPNARMLDHGGDFWADNYIHILSASLRYLIDAGCSVYLVQHDTTGDDAEIVGQLSTCVDESKLTVIAEEDPDVLKSILSGMDMVVGSRFHALASALSSGVPVIALGWSHKYTMLLQDFGCKEMCFTSACTEEDVISAIKALSSQADNSRYRRLIAERFCGMRAANERMWENVVRLINAAQTGSGL